MKMWARFCNVDVGEVGNVDLGWFASDRSGMLPS
jgi:hypothetical protein